MRRAKETVASRKRDSALLRSGRDRLSRGEAAFLDWARQRCIPLASVSPSASWDDLVPIAGMIGNANIVALSEAVHCGAEPLEFRNRLFQYLVQHHGFTAIAVESGIVESRVVHEYVRGAAGELDAILARGLSWAFDQLPQNAALIRWLRTYNADQCNDRKLNFYGFDIPGSPANNQANRGIDTALTEALEYLNRVDPAAGAAFHARLASLIDCMRFDIRCRAESRGYERWSQTDRDTLTAAIADLVTLLERREAGYIAASSASDYSWALRAAVGARQVDAWLRHIPVGWQPLREPAETQGERLTFLPIATDVRDRAQADNLEWIVEQEGSAGKILVFAARYHVSMAPVQSSFWAAAGLEREQQVAGGYLRRRFGQQLLTIGNVMGEARTDLDSTLYRAPRHSVDALARKVGVPLFMLDLRSAPPAVAEWLNERHGLADPSQVLTVVLGQAFHVLFYIESITPASGITAVM